MRSKIRCITYTKEKKKCIVGCKIMTLIYSLEVSTNPPNYKPQKSIKILERLSVICTTRVGCSDCHI